MHLENILLLEKQYEKDEDQEDSLIEIDVHWKDKVVTKKHDEQGKKQWMDIYKVEEKLEVFSLMKTCREDPFPNKVDLIVGGLNYYNYI